MTVNGSSIAGRRVLIVEDNFHIAGAIARVLKAQGAEIVGPVGTVKYALALIDDPERIDGAMLDTHTRYLSGKPLWHLFPDNGNLHRK